MALSPDRAAQARRNLERVLGEAPSREQVRAAFASYARYWLEAFRLPVEPTARLEQHFDVVGAEHLRAARAAGKGCILALPHMGNWDVAAAWITQVQGIPLTVVAERVEPERLRTWFHGFRESIGVHVVYNDEHVARELVSALRRNDAIALLCDRDVDGTGRPITFFGEETSLPIGPATLTLRTGAALLPTSTLEVDGRHRAVIGPPLEVERTGSLREDVHRVTALLAATMEERIRQAPEQWHLLQPNWPSDRRQ